jgi:hypothetical protein
MDLYDQKTLSKQIIPADTRTPYQYAYPLQIRWKDGDLVAHTTTSVIATLTASPSRTATKEPPAAGQGPSMGVIVAIAVVVGAVALVMIIAVLIWWLKKARHSIPERSILGRSYLEWTKAELGGAGAARGSSGTAVRGPPKELP